MTPVELKPLEIEILNLLNTGMHSREISKKLGYTVGWVRITIKGLKRLALYSDDPLLRSCLRVCDYQKAQKFTPAQCRLLEELIQGFQAKEIAARLGRSEGGLKITLTKARQRSKCRNTSQMVAKYVEWKHEEAAKLEQGIQWDQVDLLALCIQKDFPQPCRHIQLFCNEGFEV